MMMILVLVSIVTGLSLLDGDVTAAGLSPQQQQFLRQWKLRNKDAGQLRVVWQPADLPGNEARSQLTRYIPSLWRKPRLSLSHGVLKAGYASQQPMAASAPAPAPPPQVYVISAPAPSMPRPSKPAQQYIPPAPPPIASYNPATEPQPMPSMMKYPPHALQPSSSQPMMSYPMPAAASNAHSSSMPMSQPATAVQSSYSISQAQPGTSYRVIYIQPPEPPADAAKRPRPPPVQPAPHPPSPSYPSYQPAAAPAPQPKPAAASAEPQTLFLIVPSSSATMAQTSADPALPACSPAPADFCDNKYAGHYEDLNDDTCYIVCNKFKRGFSQRCALGTKWKRDGKYNRCA